MSDLLEHILSEDYVSACELFEERLNNIVEKKLIEKKKMMQAEAMGGMSKKDIEARRKAGYVRASEVLPDPYDYTPELKTITKKKVVVKKKKIKENTELDTPIPPSAYKAISARRRAAGQAGHPYIAPEKGGVSPAVSHVAPEDDTNKIDRSRSRAFRPSDIEKAKVAPARAKDTYQSDKDTAYALRRAGDKTAVKTFKKAYSGYRAKRELKGYGSFMKGLGSNIISGLGEENT